MSNSFIDMTGMTFGRLTVLGKVEKPAGLKTDRNTYWACRCECGTEKVIRGNSLRQGVIVSCGCFMKARVGARATKHGGHGSPEYTAWQGMKSRCFGTSNTKYHLYGGRGITVCGRWKDSFEAFLEDMGPKPSPKHSIDRVNSDGDYSPENCRWATVTEQNRNTSQNRYLTFRGETKLLKDWAESIGISPCALRQRIDLCGWSVEDAMTRPLGQGLRTDLI